jgi:hypothetical protein
MLFLSPPNLIRHTCCQYLIRERRERENLHFFTKKIKYFISKLTPSINVVKSILSFICYSHSGLIYLTGFTYLILLDLQYYLLLYLLYKVIFHSYLT